MASKMASIVLNDGTTEKVRFTDHRIDAGVAVFWYTGGYGSISGLVYYPLTSIRKWTVED